MSDEQSIRDEARAYIYKKHPGWHIYRSGFADGAEWALTDSTVIRRIQAEAWFEGADAAVHGYDLPDASNIHNPYIERGETA